MLDNLDFEASRIDRDNADPGPHLRGPAIALACFAIAVLMGGAFYIMGAGL